MKFLWSLFWINFKSYQIDLRRKQRRVTKCCEKCTLGWVCGFWNSPFFIWNRHFRANRAGCSGKPWFLRRHRRSEWRWCHHVGLHSGPRLFRNSRLIRRLVRQRHIFSSGLPELMFSILWNAWYKAGRNKSFIPASRMTNFRFSLLSHIGPGWLSFHIGL